MVHNVPCFLYHSLDQGTTRDMSLSQRTVSELFGDRAVSDLCPRHPGQRHSSLPVNTRKEGGSPRCGSRSYIRLRTAKGWD